jgi:hypothetical protein
LPKAELRPIKVRLDLVRPHSEAVYKDRKLEPPYVGNFNKNGKKLFYVAAVHESAVAIPDLLKSPTFMTIEKIFNEYSVNAVVVEGISPWSGEFPSKLLEYAKKCKLIGYKKNCGEPWFTIYKAN